jgi:hypothetical protein
MKNIAASMLLALISFIASASDVNSSGFDIPNFLANKSNRCAKDAVTVTLAPDNSAVSILLKDSSFVNTQGAGKKQLKANCHLDLVYVPPQQAGMLLQIDLRGAKVKLPLSELELTVDVGQAHHKAIFPRGQVLDGTADFIRFKVAPSASDHAKTRMHISATARSVNGQDVAQVHFDSFDACFVSADTEQACETLTQGANR